MNATQGDEATISTARHFIKDPCIMKCGLEDDFTPGSLWGHFAVQGICTLKRLLIKIIIDPRANARETTGLPLNLPSNGLLLPLTVPIQ